MYVATFACGCQAEYDHPWGRLLRYAYRCKKSIETGTNPDGSKRGVIMARLVATLEIDNLADETAEDALICPLDGNESTRSMRVLLVDTDQGERILVCDEHTVKNGFLK